MPTCTNVLCTLHTAGVTILRATMRTRIVFSLVRRQAQATDLTKQLSKVAPVLHVDRGLVI